MAGTPHAAIGVNFSASPGPAVGQPRHRQYPHVEKRAEEGSEKHDFRKYEPAHAPAEGAVDLLVVAAAFAFVRHAAEPVEHHVEKRKHAEHEQVLAPRRVVHPQRRAKCHAQQRHRAEYRPA
jgi:hypothetical protein